MAENGVKLSRRDCSVAIERTEESVSESPLIACVNQENKPRSLTSFAIVPPTEGNSWASHKEYPIHDRCDRIQE